MESKYWWFLFLCCFYSWYSLCAVIVRMWVHKNIKQKQSSTYVSLMGSELNRCCVSLDCGCGSSTLKKNSFKAWMFTKWQVVGWTELSNWAVIVLHHGPKGEWERRAQCQSKGQEEGHDGSCSLCFVWCHLPVWTHQRDKLIRTGQYSNWPRINVIIRSLVYRCKEVGEICFSASSLISDHIHFAHDLYI